MNDHWQLPLESTLTLQNIRYKPSKCNKNVITSLYCVTINVKWQRICTVEMSSLTSSHCEHSWDWQCMKVGPSLTIELSLKMSQFYSCRFLVSPLFTFSLFYHLPLYFFFFLAFSSSFLSAFTYIFLSCSLVHWWGGSVKLPHSLHIKSGLFFLHIISFSLSLFLSFSSYQQNTFLSSGLKADQSISPVHPLPI